MSYLVIEYLETTLEQSFQVNERIQVSAIRPWLYLHNDPAGTFKFAIKQNGNEIGSKELTISEIKTLAGLSDNEYHHGFIKFDFNAILNIDTSYQIELSSSGYVYDPNSYIGWVKPHENLLNSFDDVISYDDQKPLGVQMWGYK